ncbi:hypothetical protein PVAP13_5NG549286 [Panicum virgatum]|uniref:Uncharacterized protein n=1 Tax=Panicum virgatum TaxID=38727 RepID=A0A8T0S6T1_PANVG|nr:hypothetical protein PVAP13_5NG549286 [Panicum virgatum]
MRTNKPALLPPALPAAEADTAAPPLGACPLPTAGLEPLVVHGLYLRGVLVMLHAMAVLRPARGRGSPAEGGGSAARRPGGSSRPALEKAAVRGERGGRTERERCPRLVGGGSRPTRSPAKVKQGRGATPRSRLMRSHGGELAHGREDCCGELGHEHKYRRSCRGGERRGWPASPGRVPPAPPPLAAACSSRSRAASSPRTAASTARRPAAPPPFRGRDGSTELRRRGGWPWPLAVRMALAAGEPGGVRGLAAGALGLGGAGGLGDERGKHRRWKTNLTCGAHLAVREAAGPNCRKGRREEEIRGSEDISCGFADSASPCQACQAAVSCHVSQSGKNVRTGATEVLNM